MKNAPKVIVDTNVLISSLIGKPATAPILELLFRKDFALVTSEDLLEELRRVTHRPTIVKSVKNLDLIEAMLQIEAHATIVAPL